MFPRFLIEEYVRNYLREDLSLGDITPTKDVEVEGEIIAKGKGIVAGINVVKIVFEILNVEVVRSIKDGDRVDTGRGVMRIKGNARDIMMGERTALNILMWMSGIAMLTKKMVRMARKVNPTIRIAATRKTTPGFRLFEKLAVAVGGGDPHRHSLGDGIMIKDNHITIAGSIEEAIKMVRKSSFTKKIEIEVKNIEDALKAAQSGVDIIMFDNVTPEEISEAVKKAKESRTSG